MPSSSRLAACALLLACSSGPSADPSTPPALPRLSPVAVAEVPLLELASYAMTQEPAAPWTLTASDGSGLLLTRVDARAVTQGPLAFTELHVYFHNPENRVREGTFAITLPARAAVSRFAMESNGQWMEAEVVEKQLARRAYEDFLHRRQDPALLEKAAGNQFTARVFPIPARGDKHLVISFSQDLPGERYVLPLRGLPRVERIDVALNLLAANGAHSKQTLEKRNWQPDRDFVSSAPVAAEAVAAGTLVAAQLAVSGGDPVAADPPSAVTLLVDTSASRALGFAGSVAAIDRLIDELRRRHGDRLALQVVAFDQDTQPIFDGAAAGWGEPQRKALLARGAAGASDLGQALAWLAGGAPKSRLILVGDGVVTAGAGEPELAAAIKQLRGVERFDVVLAGGIRDDELAARLVRAGGRAGAVLDLEAGVAAVAAGLAERVLTDIAIEVPGATWVYPRTIASARAGTRAMVYAELPTPAQTIAVVVGGHRRSVGLAGAIPALVERATAAAHIAELEARLASATGDAARALRADIAHRSVAARVISSQASLLVLETEADYDRFGIQRTALADILEIEGDRLVQRHRTAVIARDPAPSRTRPHKKQMARKPDPGGAAAGAQADSRGYTDDAEAADEDDADFTADKRKAADDDLDAEKREESISQVESSAAPPPPPPRIALPRPSPAPAAQPEPAAEAPREPSLRARPADRAPARDVVQSDPRVRGDLARQARVASSVSGEGRGEAWPPRGAPAALNGPLAAIARSVAARDVDGALTAARAWHEREPGNVLALIGMGEALEARRELARAARMYGSIIDLFPGRADLRRFAGERLERIGVPARTLAIDTYRRAVADRPDHLTGHRLLAYALLRAGRHADAFAAILAGVDQRYPEGRFRGGLRVLGDDAGLIGAAYAAAVPARRADIARELTRRSLALAAAPSTRFILYWETDANDVDFHIQDARGGHAWYSHKQLASGGELYEDVTTGYGPECFAIPGVAKAGPYRLSLDYYSQGPMGYGMGLLQIVRHDGRGKLELEDRPFVIMADHAYVDLGSYK